MPQSGPGPICADRICRRERAGRQAADERLQQNFGTDAAVFPPHPCLASLEPDQERGGALCNNGKMRAATYKGN